jgi:hypothetical protein
MARSRGLRKIREVGEGGEDPFFFVFRGTAEWWTWKVTIQILNMEAARPRN